MYDLSVDKMGAGVLKSYGAIFGLSAALILSACGNKDEPFLTGEREDIRDIFSDSPNESPSSNTNAGVTRLNLPAAKANAEWPQAAGSPTTRPAHPALSGSPRLAWSVSIGEGDGKRARITADPVVGGGRIYALDAHAKVTAVSPSGQILWSQNLVPASDTDSDGSGGGLAYGDGKLFVTTGFGELTALDASSGNVLWRQKLQAASTGSATVLGNLVYLVAGDDVAWAIDAETGRIKWQLTATPDTQNVASAPPPAVDNKYVVFGFGSGEVQGAFRKGGLRLWDSQVAGQRLGYSSATVGDLTGAPVIAGNRIYVGNHSGRTVALELANGERIWTAPDGPLNRIWPAGDSIFMVSDRNELLRLSTKDGSRIWARPLTFFTKEKPKRQNEIVAHHGPVIAGGRLIVASNDGELRFFDPSSGAPFGTVPLPGGATTNPVVAGGVLYVVSTKGQLLAFR